jgi:GxxExxY protein
LFYRRDRRERGGFYKVFTAEIAENAEDFKIFLCELCVLCGERSEKISVVSASSAVKRGIMVTSKRQLDRITESIISAAVEVHRALGPGLLESAYEACLAFELADRGLAVEQQKALPVVYRDVHLECGYRLDLLVEQSVIVEIKSVETLMPIHEAQLLSYLKLSGCPVGLLINFNVRQLKDGIRRLVNHYPDGPVSSRRTPRVS